MDTIFVGIDVSKDDFKATVVDERNQKLTGCLTYGYGRDQLEQLYSKVERLRAENNANAVFGMESTGKYHLSLLHFLVEAGANVRLFNGLEVRGFKNRIRKVKTDSIDSECIAEAMILSQGGRLYRPPAPAVSKLHGFNRIRSRLISKITECKVHAIENLDVLCPGYSGVFSDVFGHSSINVLNLAFRKGRFLKASVLDIERSMVHMSASKASEKALRIHGLFRSSVVGSDMMDVCLLELRLVLDEYKFLNAQLLRLDSRIEKLIASIDTHIQSIPGIGLLTTGIILGELGDIDRFQTAEQVVAFAGLDPSISQSGRSRKTGHISKRGSRFLRSALYRASVTAIRVNPVCKAFYNRLKSRGKPSRLCLVAVSRKLLHIVFSVEKNKRDFYVPDYIQVEENNKENAAEKII